MDFSSYFPIWTKLTIDQQQLLLQHVSIREVKRGTMLHHGSSDCLGLLLLYSGQLRGYILSDEGREVTIYRLFERDICVLSASCIMNSIQFEIMIEAEKDTTLWVIPPDIFKQLMELSAPVSNYINEVMATRLSDVMWLIEQVVWKSVDTRLAGFLLEESALENTTLLHLTHEKIANHMGTAREVVTRMLRYFQNEGMVKLTRGTIEIIDAEKLYQLKNK